MSAAYMVEKVDAFFYSHEFFNVSFSDLMESDGTMQ